METETDFNQDQKQNLTEVTVAKTLIKYFTPEDGKVVDVPVIGKLTQAEAKNYVKSIDSKAVLVLKEVVKDTFNVSTIDLLQLKGE